MPRPSQNTDRRLIKAARKLLPETGCSGLNLRQVAVKAGVNLGMFHYHFKT
ncbi:MAG: TetR/AcrR family transcriptional regulator, partial [Burkholderiales bacterium]|nr:TetR/AcrR family transcriptional regulator [Burkholderiales bacterium]